MQHVFCSNGLGPDPALGEGDILGNGRIEVMTNHGHVEMFVERIDRVGVGRIGRRRQTVHLAGDANDVGCVATARAFRVIHVNGTAADRLERVLDKAGFIERVGVDLHLKVVIVGDAQTRIDRRRHRTPVLVQLEAHDAGLELLHHRRRTM
jgi:hypothetical protein